MNCKWFGPGCSLLAGFCLGGGFVCVSAFPSPYSTRCQFAVCILFASFPASSPPRGLGGPRKHLAAAKPPDCPRRSPMSCSASCKCLPRLQLRQQLIRQLPGAARLCLRGPLMSLVRAGAVPGTLGLVWDRGLKLLQCK